MRVRAAFVSSWREYMRYAATMAGLRPERALVLRKKIGGTRVGCYRTHSRLTMDKKAMMLVEFSFYERDGWDEMVQNVLSIDIVDFDLFVGEDLLGR